MNIENYWKPARIYFGREDEPTWRKVLVTPPLLVTGIFIIIYKIFFFDCDLGGCDAACDCGAGDCGTGGGCSGSGTRKRKEDMGECERCWHSCGQIFGWTILIIFIIIVVVVLIKFPFSGRT